MGKINLGPTGYKKDKGLTDHTIVYSVPNI
jgi:hypothetical protein